MCFSPIDQGLTTPTPYPLGSCPFHSMLHCRSWLWFILFDVCIYMMPKLIMCRIARHIIGNYPHYRNIHNQIDGGDFAFSSLPQLITYIHQANGVKTETLHSPPPWNNTVLGVPLHLYNTYTICRSVPRSIIYFERSRPIPLASMNFSHWFSAFSLS